MDKIFENSGQGWSVSLTKKAEKQALRLPEDIFFALAGHTVRNVDNGGEERIPASEVFAHVTPGMMLRGLRVKEGITQSELAERLGIAQNMVSDMESGRRNISMKMARRIAEKFDVPYKAFL